MNRPTVITGGAGFLGSHLVDTLLSRGHHVVAIDNLSHGKLENLEQAFQSPNFKFVEADVCDASSIADAVKGAGVIAHLAAFKIPRYGSRINTLVVNSQGTTNMLNAAVEHGAKFVITSTSDVYGKNPQVPFKETDPSVIGESRIARWAYAISKLYDEHLVYAYAEEYGISTSIARIFGSYGPRQNLSWWGGPQSVFIQAILDDAEIPIHGDGSQTRSFTYVDDTVAGLAALVEKPEANGEIFNIGACEEITILNLAKLIHRLIEPAHELKVKMTPYDSISSGRAYEDVMRRIPDITKARTLLGFNPKVSMEEGMRKTIAWQSALNSSKMKASYA